MRSRYVVMSAVILVLALSACKKEGATSTPPTDTSVSSTTSTTTIVPEPEVEKIEATPEAVKQANEDLKQLADRDRRMHAALSFEEFKATVYREPFEGGRYIVNGDTPIDNDKQLLEFYEQNVKPRTARIIVAQINGVDQKWTLQQIRNLTYCVSSTFGSRHDAVAQQMANAAGEWEKVSKVHFIHDATQDGNCGPSNTAVLFDVRPVDVEGEYLARAFFPNEPRAVRNVLIDESSFTLPANENLQLVGILRHELGHTLGFRHEHTRPESGTCFEDNDWKPLTSYDAFSVMHYPQCNGKADWSLVLTDKDKNGVACLYGRNTAFTIDPTIVKIATCIPDETIAPTNQPETETFPAQSVAKNAQNTYGPFPVAANSTLEVAIGGPGASGDPDLYVRYAAFPRLQAYNCRPFLDGPTELCSLTVPANESQAFVMVRGYAEGTYDLRVTHVPPTPAGGGGTP